MGQPSAWFCVPFLLCRGLLPPSGTGAVWCAWCCCLLGFCRIGEFFSHTREQRGLRENPRKFLRAGDMLAYGLRVCVCVRLPALPPAPPCGRSFPPGYAPMSGGLFSCFRSVLSILFGYPPGPPSRRFPAPRSRLRVTVCRCVYHTPVVYGLQGCCGVFSAPCPLVIPSFKPIYRERLLCLPVPKFLVEGLSLCSFGGKDFILYVGIAAVLCGIPTCF